MIDEAGSELRTVSPVDGSVYVRRPLATAASVDTLLDQAGSASATWRQVPLGGRIALVRRLIDHICHHKQEIATELTWQMGRPIRHTPGEIDGFAARGYRMLELASTALADVPVPVQPGFRRFIRREPVGVVLVLAPWNYPFLTAVNTVVPALLAGNTVLLKHSDQTPLVAERLTEAGRIAGLPDGVFQHVHMSHSLTAKVVADGRVHHVAFTGSVEGGRAVHAAAGGFFKGVGLELGGKDPAYVRPDADLDHTANTLVDGAFFNAGQSCCAIERIYAHQSIYQPLVEKMVALTRRYTLGDPTHPNTNLGPVVRPEHAEAIQKQIRDAIAAGARGLIDPNTFPETNRGAHYLAPQILLDVDHTMDIMTEETFGPVVGIASVRDDDQAIERMNDSRYGLTASVFTEDAHAAMAIGDQILTGTWFMNRCDYLDPDLAWVGIKDSGRGATLSALGFDALTRPKSFHLRLTFEGPS